MQPFFITKNHSTFGGQFAPKTDGQWRAKKGGQFHRNFQLNTIFNQLIKKIKAKDKLSLNLITIEDIVAKLKLK